MPFTKLLTRMVESVEGAQGAIFLDGDCEYVQYAGHIDSFRHKLLGAYQGILLGLIRKSIAKLRVSGLDKIVTEYESATFITKNLRGDYFMVLVLGSTGNIGQGIREVDRTAERINQEID
jgi:predicted regulator of Ras-like GTPase activity (Roadblock/LC7/MglB family)